MNILVINAGSSSIKVSLFDASKLSEPEVAPLWQASLLFTSGNNAELSVSVHGSAASAKDSTSVSMVSMTIPASVVTSNTKGSNDSQNATRALYAVGLSVIFNSLVSGEYKILPSLDTVDAVGHRVVHGGNYYSDSVVIDDEVVRNLKQCIELAPEHGPANLECITAARKHLPYTPQVAVFDTAFHQTMPESAKVLPGPYEWYKKHGIRRFGFHGISHKYCAGRAVELLKPELFKQESGHTINSTAEATPNKLASPRTSSGIQQSIPTEANASIHIAESHNLRDLRMITCHLGAGASLCAIKNGASVMTTMSFTPLDGLIMKTRSGAIDPGVIFHLLRRGTYTADQLDRVLNGESGLKGISGLSGDMREMLKVAGYANGVNDSSMSATNSMNTVGSVNTAGSSNNIGTVGNVNTRDSSSNKRDSDNGSGSDIGSTNTKQRTQLALDMFVDSVASNIAALIPRLGGLNALIFTAGIGENSPKIRSSICQRLTFLGMQLDEKQNTDTAPATTKADKLISTPNSKIHCLVIHTREDLLIARECTQFT